MKKPTVKRIIACVLAAILLSALPACKVPENTNAPETETARVEFEAFKNSLYKRINETEIYKISLGRTTETDDGTATMHVFDIVQDLVFSQERLMLLVSCDADGFLTSVSCFADDSASSNVSIALISYYTYKSLGLSDLDADAFYGAFAFFEDEPAERYEKEENGWWLSVSYKEDGVNFYAFQLGA